MKKIRRNSKKGFTLVELIVVLVILAILAAMLVPALTGYIDRAKKEKDYQTASVIYAAAQAVITERYGNNTLGTGTAITANPATATDDVIVLAGVNIGSKTVAGVYAYSFTYGTNHVITNGAVAIYNRGELNYYKLSADGTWGPGAATDIPTP